MRAFRRRFRPGAIAIALLLAVSSVAGAAPRRGYHGHPRPEAEDLQLVGVRHLSLTQGRFTSPDPGPADLRNPQTFANRYRAPGVNPALRDPDGRWIGVAAGLLATAGLVWWGAPEARKFGEQAWAWAHGERTLSSTAAFGGNALLFGMALAPGGGAGASGIRKGGPVLADYAGRVGASWALDVLYDLRSAGRISLRLPVPVVVGGVAMLRRLSVEDYGAELRAGPDAAEPHVNGFRKAATDLATSADRAAAFHAEQAGYVQRSDPDFFMDEMGKAARANTYAKQLRAMAAELEERIALITREIESPTW
jgi:hypothetical protein